LSKKKDNYKRAHRFYSLHNNIRYVHTYYKNKDRRRKKKEKKTRMCATN